MSPRLQEQPQSESSKHFDQKERDALFFRSQLFLMEHSLKRGGQQISDDEQLSTEHNPQSEEWVAQHSTDYRRFFEANADRVCSLIEDCNIEEECPEQVETIMKEFETFEKTQH